MHSASISVIDNIAAGSGESGFAYFGKGEGATKEPVTNFKGNTSFGSKVAMLAWKFTRSQIVFDHFNVWNTGGVLWTNLFSNLTFKDSLLIKNVDNPSGAIIGLAYGGGMTIKRYNFENTTMVGWERVLPPYPTQSINVTGGYYNNIESFQLGVATGGQIPQFNNVKFGELSEEALKGRTQRHILLSSIGLETPNFRQEFMSQGVGADIDGQHLYLDAQSPDHIPFPNAGLTVPDQFVGKTNQELLDEYGIVPGGAITPADAIKVPGFDGLLGTPPSKSSVLATLLSP